MNSAWPLAQLCFGEVLHRRLRPVQHRFRYPLYFVRMPLRSPAVGVPPTCRWFSHNRFNLLSFYDCDHGDGQQPLLSWLDGVLRAEGIADADGAIWLQTFPRVLGYVFNPVAFWLCHRANGDLRAIVCEVRNTFGERHCYLLETGATIVYGRELLARKVFHVSPFCATDGLYRFRFMRDLAAVHQRWVARIEYDDADGPLVLTSISGRAGELNDSQVLKGFFGYPLMTFGVIVRIHWQALRLWSRRVPFFKKPSPPSTQVSR